MSNTVGYSLGCVTPVRYNLTQGEDATGNTVAFSLPSCTPSVGDEVVTLSTVSQSSTPTLIGFPEYVDPSSPPKKYRTKTSVPNPGYRDVRFSTCSGTLYGSDVGILYGEESYDAVTGVFTSSARHKLLQSFGSAPPTTVVHDIPTVLPLVPFESSDGLVATSGRVFTQLDSTLECLPDPGSGSGLVYSYTADCRYRIDLTAEDTESDAISRASVTFGTNTVASRTARTTGFSFDLVTVEATLHCSNLRPEFSYRVRYDLKETNLDTLQETLIPYEVDIPAGSISYDVGVALVSDPGFSLELINYNLSIR